MVNDSSSHPSRVDSPRNGTDRKPIPWHNRSAGEVLAHLGSSATGLSATEAAQRLAANGPNELKKGTRISPLALEAGDLVAADPVDPDAMNRRPRHRLESITDRSFLRTMAFTGFLTAGVAFAVYFYVLRTGPTETARTYAFARDPFRA